MHREEPTDEQALAEKLEEHEAKQCAAQAPTPTVTFVPRSAKDERRRKHEANRRAKQHRQRRKNRKQQKRSRRRNRG